MGNVRYYANECENMMRKTLLADQRVTSDQVSTLATGEVHYIGSEEQPECSCSQSKRKGSERTTRTDQRSKKIFHSWKISEFPPVRAHELVGINVL